MSHPSRVVPTLTEVLDEAAWRPESAAPAVWVPAPEHGVPKLPGIDFDLDLDLDLGNASPALPMLDAQSSQGVTAGLRQELGPALEAALDELLQQAVRDSVEQVTAGLADSLLLALRKQLAPLLQQAIDEALNVQRERLPR